MRSIRKFFSIFIYMMLTMLIAGSGFAEAQTTATGVDLALTSPTVDASQNTTVTMDVTVSDPSQIAGAAFTVLYDTEDLTLTDVQSTFFDTFANQFTAVNPGYTGQDSVTVGEETYNQPVVKGPEMMDMGTMIAGARVQAGETANTTLFTLVFNVENAFNGIYRIGIMPSMINNTDAGYSAMGEPIPMLVGATDATDLSLAYPEIPVNSPDTGIYGTLTVSGSTSSDSVMLNINQPFSFDEEAYVDVATSDEWDIWFHTDTNVLEVNGLTLKPEPSVSSFGDWPAGGEPDHSSGTATSIELDDLTTVVGSIFSIKIDEEGIDCLYGLVQITGYVAGESITFDFMPLGCWDYSMFEEGDEQGCGGDYAISGRITDKDTGAGVPGLWIDIYSDDVWCGGRYMTDQSGDYTATGLIPGNYIISYWPPYDSTAGTPVYMDAYYDSSNADTGTTRNWETATRVLISDGGTNPITGIDMALSTGETITGNIFADAEKTTRIDYRVWVDAYSETTNSWAGTVAEGGAYTLTGLEAAGDYKVAARPYYPENSSEPEHDFMELWWTESGGINNWEMAQPLSTDYTSSVDFIIKEGATISGRLVDENYEGVSGIWVSAWSEDTMSGNGTETDAEGNFTIKGLESDATYIVEVFHPDYAYVSESGVAAGTTGITLVLSTGAAISGRVTNEAGGPVNWVWVEAWSPSTGGWGGANSGENPDFTWNGDGVYTITGLPPADDYIVTVWPYDYPSQEYASVVNITSGDASNINFVLSAGKHIAGTVTDGTNPVPNVWIEAYSDSTWSWGNALTDQSGAYTITGLADASDYRVSYWPDPASGVKFMPAFYSDAGTQTIWENATLVDITMASADAVDLTLTTGAAITGKVTSGATGLRDIWVDAWSETTGTWAGAYTAEGGAYTLSGLAPSNDYIVTVYPFNQAPVSQSAVSAPAVDLNFDLATATGKVIKGRVALSDDTALGNVWVNVWSASTGSWGSAQTDLTGNFVITGLADASDFELDIWTPDYGNFVQTGVASSDSETAVSIPITLSEGTTISGSISGISGTGWNFWVDAWSDTSNSWGGVEALYNEVTGTYDYTIKGLSDAVSDYRVSVNGYNYLTGQNVMTLFYTENGGTTVWDNAQLVDLTGGSVEGVDFAVSTGKSIAGTISIEGVTAPNPLLEGIWVDAWSDTQMSWGGAMTDASGAYTVTGLAAASDYRVSVWKDGYPSVFYGANGSTPIWENATLVDVTQSDRTGIDVLLTKGGTISGTVTNSNGRALQNAWIDVYSPTQNFGMGAMTDINGRYEVTGLMKSVNGQTINDYIVTAYPPPETNYKMVSKSGKSAGDVVNFTLTTGFTLYGKVTNPDNSDFVGGAWVDIWNDTFYGWAEVSTADGTFSIKGLTDGTYQIYIWPYTGNYKQIEQLDTALTSASSSAETPMAFQFNAGLSITGTVTDADGNGISGVYVDAWSETTGDWGSAATDAGGAYTITGLSTGSDYQVWVWAPGYPDESRAGVSAGATGVDFTLSNGGSISGSVVYKGVPRAGVWVEAWSKSTQSWSGAVTASDGTFTLSGLLEKTQTGLTVTDYVVTVYPENLAVMSRSGLSTGTANLEFSLTDGDTISGTITDSAGTGLANVKVKFYDAGTGNNGVWINNVFTDENGTFEIKGLDGSNGYNIKAEKTGYTAAWYDADTPDTQAAAARTSADVVYSGDAMTMKLTLAAP